MKRYLVLGLLALVAFGAGVGVSLWHQKQGKGIAAQQDQVPESVLEMTRSIQERAALKMENALSEIAEGVSQHDEIFADSPPVPAVATGAVADDAPAQESEKPTVVAGEQVGSHFTLTDHNGNKVDQSSFDGKHLLVFFGFTHCPDICPVTLDKLTEIFAQSADLAEKAQVLFVTVDPARDSVATMQEYMSAYHPSFVGLTGTEDEVKAVVETFKVYVAKAEPAPQAPAAHGHDAHGHGESHDAHADHADHGAPAGYLVDHSAFIYVMSPESEMLGVVRSDAAATEMAKDIREKMAAQPLPVAP